MEIQHCSNGVAKDPSKDKSRSEEQSYASDTLNTH